MVSPLRTFFDFVNFPNRFLLLMFALIVSSLLSKIVFQQSQPLGSFILIWKAWDDDKIIKIEYCGCAEWLWTCGIHIMIDDQIFPKVVLCSVGCKVKAHWGKIQDAKVLLTTYSEPFLFAGIATDFDPRAIITQILHVKMKEWLNSKYCVQCAT